MGCWRLNPVDYKQGMLPIFPVPLDFILFLFVLDHTWRCSGVNSDFVLRVTPGGAQGITRDAEG